MIKLLRVAVPAVSLIATCTVVTPVPAVASNVFCGADASYVPWDVARNAPTPEDSASERAIRVVLYTPQAATANALVTFITADSAYQATIAGVKMHAQAGGGDYESDPVLVAFPQSLGVEFAYVDSFSVNSAPLASCPSFVNQVDAYGAPVRPNTALPSLHRISAEPTMPKSYTGITATMLQALPSLSCGSLYTPARVALLPQSDWSVQDEMASYDTGRTGMTAVVAVAVGSDGKPLDQQIVRSSGNHVTDREALDQARTETYSPAQFLCTPVVSLVFMTFQQK
jgi:TonB family protein